MPAPPSCSVVVETSDWQPDHRIQLWDVLDEVVRQADAESADVIVVVDAIHAPRRREIEARYPSARVIQGADGDGYYANKHRGLASVRTEFAVLTDANCMPQPGWLAAATRAFAEAEPSLAAVQGRTFFDRDALSRLWDAVWWARSTWPRGPVDRLYSGNNLALRMAAYRQHPYDLSWPHHTGSERLLGERFRAHGYALWLEPAMRVAHNYRASTDVLLGLARVRGYYIVASRSRPSSARDRWIRRLRWALPLALAPTLWPRDVARLLRRWRGVGLAGRDAWKLPGYVVVLLLHAMIAATGAVRALRGRPPYSRPS
jgi:hypothetical protein